MAIQFQCPLCSAAIRVADSAAGKKGRCPQCGQPLLVPRVEPPPDAAPPPVAAPEPSAGGVMGLPGIEEPGAGAGPFPLPDSTAGETGPFPFAADAGAPVVSTARPPSIARQLRRRQRFRAGRLLVPLIFGGILVGAGLWLFWKSTPRMEGTLSAVRLEDFGPVSRPVDLVALDLPHDRVRTALENLKLHPLPLVSPLMAVDLTAVENGLNVELRRGRETVFYRVNVISNPLAREFVREHRPRLDGARMEELRQAAATFVRDWQDPGKITASIEQLRNSLGLAALSGTLGFHLQAVAGGGAYRAVYQDDEGRIYFLLPRGTNHFRIEGRPLENGQTLFPGKFVVNVAAPQEPVAEPSEPPPQDESAPEPETDMETPADTGAAKSLPAAE